MKVKTILTYILNSVSYGILFAIAFLLLVPNSTTNFFLPQLFNQQKQTPDPLSFAKAVSLASPAVVNIYSEEIQSTPRYGQKTNRSARLGSGVIMDSNGYILTNLHVIQHADLIQVLLQNGQFFPAELIGFDIPTDLAVLKVNASNLPVIPQQSEQKTLVGDVVLAIGNPLNLGQTVTQGIISATGRNGLSSTSYSSFHQMDAAINEGNSGGALVDTNGTLVGINSRKYDTQSNSKLDIQGIFFAIPYQLADKIMREIIENGRVVRGWLGVSSERYLTDVKGFIVQEVNPNSPAAASGMQPGDVIYQIGEQPITSITQALDIVAETKPNTLLLFKLYRQGKSLEMTVKIKEYHN